MEVEEEHVDRVANWPPIKIVFFLADEAEALRIVEVFSSQTLVSVTKKLSSKSSEGITVHKTSSSSNSGISEEFFADLVATIYN